MENEELLDLQPSDILLAEIEKRVEELKKEHDLKKVIPMIVENEDGGVKVVYMKHPSFGDFSKFQTMGKSNEMLALRQLARDCFLDGDRSEIDDDQKFMTGIMSNMSAIITFRRSAIVDLSKARK